MGISVVENSKTALELVNGYAASLGREENSLSGKMTDVIADIAHLCNEKGISFEKVVNTAEQHFEMEIESE